MSSLACAFCTSLRMYKLSLFAAVSNLRWRYICSGCYFPHSRSQEDEETETKPYGIKSHTTLPSSPCCLDLVCAVLVSPGRETVDCVTRVILVRLLLQWEDSWGGKRLRTAHVAIRLFRNGANDSWIGSTTYTLRRLTIDQQHCFMVFSSFLPHPHGYVRLT